MNILIPTFLTILISIIGFLIIFGFNLMPKKSFIQKIAVGYGLGVGFVTIQLYLYSRLNISWDKWMIVIPWFILSSVIILKQRDKIKIPKIKIKKIDLITLALILGIGASLGYAFFEAILRPISAWDVWAIWQLKSKIFFIDGGINPEMLNYVLSDYPLIVSLLGTLIYIFLGKVDDTAVIIPFFGFFLFTALLFFTFLREKFTLRYSLLFTFLFVTIQNLVRHGGRFEAGQADLPLAFFIFCSTLLLFAYLKDKSIKTLILLNVFLGFCTLIKFEGIPFVIVTELILTIFIFRQRLYKHLLVLLIPLFFILDWQIYKSVHNLDFSYLKGHPLRFDLNVIPGVLKDVARELVNVRSWSLLWIVFFLSMFISKKNKEINLLNLIICFQLLVYLGIYFFTAGNFPESSFSRLLIHITPLAILSISLTAKIAVKKN